MIIAIVLLIIAAIMTWGGTSSLVPAFIISLKLTALQVAVIGLLAGVLAFALDAEAAQSILKAVGKAGRNLASGLGSMAGQVIGGVGEGVTKGLSGFMGSVGGVLLLAAGGWLGYKWITDDSDDEAKEPAYTDTSGRLPQEAQ